MNGHLGWGRTYIGLVHKDAGSDCDVSFLDLPGCVTAGATLEEARVMAGRYCARRGQSRANTRVACSAWAAAVCYYPHGAFRTRRNGYDDATWKCGAPPPDLAAIRALPP